MALIIEAKGLTKRFGKTQALDGLDLAAESGQVVAMLGPNGAGKTTFIRAVATLLQPDSGELRVGGHDVRREAPAVRRAIGLAGQFAAIEPAMTGRENLELVARLFGQKRRDAKANASSVLDSLRLTDAGDRLVRTYSGGMRRRLDLGASLVGAPKLLLLDEPTSGISAEEKFSIMDLIMAALAKENIAVMFIEHDMDIIGRYAQRVLAFVDGTIVASGEPAAVLADPQVRRAVTGEAAPP